MLVRTIVLGFRNRPGRQTEAELAKGLGLLKYNFILYFVLAQGFSLVILFLD